MPCEFVLKVDPSEYAGRQYLRCFRIEGHFGLHRDEYGGRFRSNTLDTDVMTYDSRYSRRSK